MFTFSEEEDVKENMGTEYKGLKIRLPAGAASKPCLSSSKNEADGKRWEVHIPKEHPTSQKWICPISK